MRDEVEVSEDWHSHPDAPEPFMDTVVSAILAEDEAPIVSLLDEVDALLNSRNEELARLLTQAALHRTVNGPPSPKRTKIEALTEAAHFDGFLQEAQDSEVVSKLRASALQAAARILSHEHEHTHALALYNLCVQLWTELGNSDSAALAMLRAGASAHYLGDMSEALEISNRARAAFQSQEDIRGQILATLNLAQTFHSTGDLDRAEELLKEAKQLAASIRDGHINTSILAEESALLAEQGEVDKARDGFLRAYRSSKRRQDREQMLVLAKNLAQAARDKDQPRRALYWWSVVSKIAEERGDWIEQQGAQRSRGVLLAELERYEESIEAFGLATEINKTHSDPQGEAQSQADLGATLLNYSLADNIEEDRFNELSAEAEKVLDAARGVLESLDDFEWAAITVRNLRVAWTLLDKERQGSEVLATTAATFREDSSSYTSELLRNAAWLRLGSGSGDEQEATAWLVSAVAASANDPVDRAWALAREASSLAASSHSAPALQLFDQALTEIDSNSHPSTFGNILNDSALVAVDLNDLSDARRRLLQVQTIGEASEDRALQALAAGNLGETAIREDDLEQGREFFQAAARLSADLGDTAQEAIAYASIANSYVEEKRLDEAKLASERAVATARNSRSSAALVRAQSSSASVAYGLEDYELAFDLWSDCASQQSTDSSEYQAFALDSLAQIGDWPRFRRQLDRYTRQAQRSGTQFDLVEKLDLPAITWWRNGNARGAGVVLAYGILLSFEAASKTYGPGGRKLTSAERYQAVLKASGSMGAIRAFFLLLDLTEQERTTARRAYERTIRSSAGEDASRLIEIVDSLALAPEENSSKSIGEDTLQESQ